MVQNTSWKDLAEKKRNAILDSIPPNWRLEKSKLPSNEQQKDVTGYIQQFLSKRGVEITETDVVGIAKETSAGNWTATEVTEAFCHRASLAHQLVSDDWLRSATLICYVASAHERISALEFMLDNRHSLFVRASTLGKSLLTAWFEDRLSSRNVFSDAALSDAKSLDEYFSKNKKPIGPLHGVPISLKDQFHVKNVETTMGYVGWIGTFQGKEGRSQDR